MGRCLLCGNRKLFVALNRDRLCRVCSVIVAGDRQQLLLALKDPGHLLHTPKKFETRLSQCDIIIAHARALLEYEKRGIRTMTPLPSEIIEKYQEVRKRIVSDGVREEVGILLEKASQAPTPQASVALADEALLKICEARKKVGQDQQLDDLERQASQFIQRTQLDICLDAARIAESRGEKKKALDHYLKALDFLRGAEGDDSLFQKSAAAIKNKIAQLRG